MPALKGVGVATTPDIADPTLSEAVDGNTELELDESPPPIDEVEAGGVVFTEVGDSRALMLEDSSSPADGLDPVAAAENELRGVTDEDALALTFTPP